MPFSRPWRSACVASIIVYAPVPVFRNTVCQSVFVFGFSPPGAPSLAVFDVTPRARSAPQYRIAFATLAPAGTLSVAVLELKRAGLPPGSTFTYLIDLSLLFATEQAIASVGRHGGGNRFSGHVSNVFPTIAKPPRRLAAYAGDAMPRGARCPATACVPGDCGHSGGKDFATASGATSPPMAAATTTRAEDHQRPHNHAAWVEPGNERLEVQCTRAYALAHLCTRVRAPPRAAECDNQAMARRAHSSSARAPSS